MDPMRAAAEEVPMPTLLECERSHVINGDVNDKSLWEVIIYSVEVTI